MGEYSLVKIVKSDKPGKKLMAVFKNKKTGREKTVHFGDASMSDYTRHKDTERKGRYQNRHRKDLKTGDPTRAGFLSYYILWGKSTSLKENIAAYKRKFFPGSLRKTQSSPKPSKNSGLRRWFAEEWVDEKGDVCGSSKNKNTKKCRPKKRISKDTPVTWNEMSPTQKRRAVAKKKQVGMGRRAPAIRKRSKVTMKNPKTVSRKPRRVRMCKPTKTRKSNKAVPANPALYNEVKAEAKRKFKVWPSAYGSGWLVKTYKQRGGTYK
tara:strand:- start:3292 stop:4086 length:795 start_codon:yes stop_codon:yes gene_type:complete